MIRILIVEDEIGAVNELVDKLSRLHAHFKDEIEIAGIARNYKEAVEKLAEKPDLIFLDNVLLSNNEHGHNFFKDYILSTTIEVIFITGRDKDPSGFVAENYRKYDIPVLYKDTPDKNLVETVNHFITSRNDKGRIDNIKSIYSFIKHRSTTPYAGEVLTINKKSFRHEEIVYMIADGSVTNVYFSNHKKECAPYNLGHYLRELNVYKDNSLFRVLGRDKLLNLDYFYEFDEPNRILLKEKLILQKDTIPYLDVGPDAFLMLQRAFRYKKSRSR